MFVCLCEHSDLLVPAPEECFYHHFIPQILTNPRADLANVEWELGIQSASPTGVIGTSFLDPKSALLAEGWELELGIPLGTQR